MTRPEIVPLTSFRFVAALYVFLFHIHIRWPLLPPGFFANIVLLGAVGMAFFFVLSGFILTYQYHGTSVSARQFYISRFARIYPVYLLAACLTVPWLGIVWPAHDAAPQDWFFALGQMGALVGSNLLLLQAWIPHFFGLWNDGGSWSIAVEAFFYALFPLILPVLARGSPKTWWKVAAACCLLSFLPEWIYILFQQPQPAATFYSMPIFRLPEFVFGICLCLLSGTVRVRRWDCLIGATLLLLGVYLGLVGPRFPSYVGHNAVVLPLLGVLFIGLRQSQGRFVRVLSWRPLVWCGRVSYAFYSIQVLFIILLVHYHEMLVAAVPALRHNLLLALAAFLSLLACAGMVHHFLEEPARRYLKSRLGRAL
ncbi:MAG: acyltransferase [Alphaproteobacteria bacterium]|nr:acyltransferase [Alphaproteobacteria bacterium]